MSRTSVGPLAVAAGSRPGSRQLTSLVAVVALLMSMVTVSLVLPGVAAAAVPIPFAPFFSAQDNGAIALVGNSQMTCPSSDSNCAKAQSAVATANAQSNVDDNEFAMGFIDADSDSTTTNSTSANLSIPAGSTVLSALLVWGGRRDTAPGVTPITAAAAAQIRFKAPGASAYTQLTGGLDDPKLTTGTDSNPYQGYIDVTSTVKAAGNGTYWAANIAATTGQDRYAGWSLIVAYRNPSAPLRDLEIFKGFANVNGSGADATATINISGFLTPTTGVVNSSIGVVAWEGDRGLVGDGMQFNGTTLSDATRPATNFFNSAISDAGVPITARSPNYANNLGFDIGRINAPGVLANSQTSTTVKLTTAGDTYYPSIVTTQIDLFTPAFNPVIKTVTDLQGNSPTAVGDTLLYQVSLTNIGADPADLSVMTDPLPPNITYTPGSLVLVANPGSVANSPLTDAADSDQGEYLPGSRTIKVRLGSGANGTTGGTIGVNQTATVRFRATVDRTAAGTTVSNTASLNYRAHTINKTFDFIGNQVDTPVGPIADLAITKSSAPTTQTAGSGVVYTMTGTNNGPNGAANVVMTDTLPVGITYVSSAPPAGTSCSVAARVVTCTTASVPNGGSVVVPITTSIAAGTAAATLTDQAAISSDTADDVPANNSAIASTVVTTSADVSLTKAVSPNPVRAGTAATYVLTATNAGPSNATSVTVTDPVPAGQTITSATTSVGTCSITGSVVTCPIGTLGPTGSATITVVTAVGASTAASPANNTATVSSATPDPNTANNSATAALTINTSADLVITKTAATNPVVAGTAQSYTIKVVNNGPSDAVGVKVSDPAVTGLTLSSASPTQGSCTITAGAVNCLLGTVGVNSTVTITVQGSVGSATAPGTLTNTATVSSDTPDPDSATNTVSTPVTVNASADVSLSKSASPSTIVAGTNVTYTLTATNTGPSQALGVSISDPLPANLTFVSSANGCTAAAGTVTCPVGTLTSGQVVTRSFIALAGPDLVGTVINTATVSATTPDPNVTNNTASTSSATGQQADLTLTKTTSATPIAGGQITYTLRETNNGPSTAAAVVVTDTLPAGITFVSGTVTGGTCTASGQTVTCALGTAGIAGTRVITIVGNRQPDRLGFVDEHRARELANHRSEPQQQ